MKKKQVTDCNFLIFIGRQVLSWEIFREIAACLQCGYDVKFVIEVREIQFKVICTCIVKKNLTDAVESLFCGRFPAYYFLVKKKLT